MTFEPFIGSALLDASHLAAHLRQLAGVRAQLFAVRLEVLRGKRVTSQPWPAAVLRQPLWALTEERAAALYVLGESDLVLLCNNLPVDRVDEAVTRIARLFEEEAEGGRIPCIRVKWYDLVRNDDFEALISAASANGIAHRIVQTPLRSITIADLPVIVDRVRRIPLARMIRRENVLLMQSVTNPVPLFQELSVTIGESQRLFAPGVDAATHPALSSYLKESFDRAVLTHLGTPEGAPLTRGSFSVNVSVSTLLQPIFARFEEAFTGRDDVLLEIPLDDVLDDIGAYFAVRDRVRAAGFRVVLDGINSSSLVHLDVGGFNADLIKIRCPAQGRFARTAKWVQSLERCLDQVGRDRVIFTQIQSEECLRWAFGVGISRLQGLFVDKLVRAFANKGLLGHD